MNKPYYPPSPLYHSKPSKQITKRTEISRTQIYSGDEITFNPNSKYCFDKEYDDDEYNYFLVEYTESVIDNPNYDVEMKKFHANNERHQKALDKYAKDIKIWESQEVQRKTQEYYRLKSELGI